MINGIGRFSGQQLAGHHAHDRFGKRDWLCAQCGDRCELSKQGRMLRIDATKELFDGCGHGLKELSKGLSARAL